MNRQVYAGLCTRCRDGEQTFSCQPDGVVSGTQPVCEPLPSSAPKVDSEYGVGVCIDGADEGRAAIPLWEIRPS